MPVPVYISHTSLMNSFLSSSKSFCQSGTDISLVKKLLSTDSIKLSKSHSLKIEIPIEEPWVLDLMTKGNENLLFTFLKNLAGFSACSSQYARLTDSDCAALIPISCINCF